MPHSRVSFRMSLSDLSKPHIGTTRGLRRGAQFGVPVREDIVTVCVGMRGDACRVKQCVYV